MSGTTRRLLHQGCAEASTKWVSGFPPARWGPVADPLWLLHLVPWGSLPKGTKDGLTQPRFPPRCTARQTQSCFFFFFFRRPQPHTADGDARAGVRGTGSAPGLAADLPREPGLLLPRLLLAGSFKPVPLECFLLVGPETLHRKEFCIAIPILQTRKLPDCHFPKAVFLARSLEIKSRANSCTVEESVPTGQIQQRG